MRHNYCLTDLSRAALKSAKVKDIAKEWNVDEDYLYGILSNNNTDPFAPFRMMFKSIVDAGGDALPYLTDLTVIYKRGRQQFCEANLTECLLKKIHTDGETTANLVDALKDGELDRRECRTLLQDIEKIRSNLELLETYALHRLSVISDEEANKGKGFRVARTNGANRG